MRKFRLTPSSANVMTAMFLRPNSEIGSEAEFHERIGRFSSVGGKLPILPVTRGIELGRIPSDENFGVDPSRLFPGAGDGRLDHCPHFSIRSRSADAGSLPALRPQPSRSWPSGVSAPLSFRLTTGLFSATASRPRSFSCPTGRRDSFFLGQTARFRNGSWPSTDGCYLASPRDQGQSVLPIGFLLEVAYLFCYPLVPLSLLTLYIAGLRGKVHKLWLVVLVSTYVCYAVTPLVPSLPPRSLIGGQADVSVTAEDTNKGRTINRWILKHGSIHAISFPSAHVASAVAIALVFLRYSLPLGVIFLVVAVLISLGAVAGRYHYALDVLLGAATACAVYLASQRWL